MAVSSNSEIGKKLRKLFNLPEGTKSFELRVAVDEAVTIKCEYYPKEEDSLGVDLVTAKFELKEITE